MIVWIITLLVLALVARAWVLSRRQTTFNELPPDPGLQLAIAKETLLNHPQERHLQLLEDMCKKHGIACDGTTYLPLLELQRNLLGKRPPDWLARDEELFVQQARWLDSLIPPEFSALPTDEESAKQWLRGCLRLYSDEAEEKALQILLDKGPARLQKEFADLEVGWRNLVQLRDQSGADADSLERIAKQKEAWESKVRELAEL